MAQKWKYNNREFEEVFDLNLNEMDFRHYDNAIGRFMVVDPLAENFHDWTPYRFGFNSPIFYSDPLGLIEKSVVLDMYNRSPNGKNTRWENDGHSGFYTNDGGYVGYTSDDTAYNTSPGSMTVLPEVVVTKNNKLSYQNAAWMTQLNIYQSKWYSNNDGPMFSQRKAHNLREAWSFSNNVFASSSYNVANDLFQVIQVFDFNLIRRGTNPLTGQRTNINIDGTANYKPMEGFVNTATLGLPLARGTKVVSSVAPKGIGYLKKFNAAQFSKFFKGNLSRLAPQYRGYLNKQLNKGIDAFNNQVSNGMILLKTLMLED